MGSGCRLGLVKHWQTPAPLKAGRSDQDPRGVSGSLPWAADGFPERCPSPCSPGGCVCSPRSTEHPAGDGQVPPGEGEPPSAGLKPRSLNVGTAGGSRGGFICSGRWRRHQCEEDGCSVGGLDRGAELPSRRSMDGEAFLSSSLYGSYPTV